MTETLVEPKKVVKEDKPNPISMIRARMNDMRQSGESITVVHLYANCYRVHFKKTQSGLVDTQRSLFVECDGKDVNIREKQ